MNWKKKDIINYFELVLVFSVLSFSGFLKYIVFSAWILYYGLYRGGKIIRKDFAVVVPSLVCVGIGTLFALIHGFNMESFKEIVFTVLPPLGAMIIWKAKRTRHSNYIYLLFWAITTVFFLTTITHFTAENLLESQYAFIFGIFAVYFLYTKDYRYLAVDLVVLLLANKRIALAASVAGLIVVLVLNHRVAKMSSTPKRARTLVWLVGLATAAILLTWVYVCHTDTITDWMRKGSINSQGRIDVWRGFRKYYTFSLWETGKGLGFVSTVLTGWNIRQFARLHNDILVYYIELGFIGLVLYVLSYFWMINYYIKKRVATYRTAVILCSFIVYNFACFSTDNISIYINYLFPLYIIILECISMDGRDITAKNSKPIKKV